VVPFSAAEDTRSLKGFKISIGHSYPEMDRKTDWKKEFDNECSFDEFPME
jgi:hypothetical protein